MVLIQEQRRLEYEGRDLALDRRQRSRSRLAHRLGRSMTRYNFYRRHNTLR